MVLIFISIAIVFKSVKSFYLKTFSNNVSTLIAFVTSIMLLASTILLFKPKEFVRGTGASEVDLSVTNFAILFLIVATVYYLFTYKPSKKQ